MIARLWRGIVRANLSEQYLNFLRERVIPAYQFVDGGRGLHILFDTENEFTTVLIISFWETRAALAAFADPQRDPETCRTERDFLLASESRAAVYEVTADSSC